MADFVNIIDHIGRDIRASGISLHYDEEGGRLNITSPANETTSLTLKQLYRPSSNDIQHNAEPGTLLVMTAASEKAVRAAAHVNHILVPAGGFRIVAPGLVLVSNSPVKEIETGSRQVRLAGRTGVVAESLLVEGKRPWSVQQLAAASRVSPALAQRVINRLERDGLLSSSGLGPEKTRTVNNPRALAELWSQDEKSAKPLVSGYLYGSTNEAIASQVLQLYPGSAIGGTFAANLYVPVLTRVSPPIRIWVADRFDQDDLVEVGFKETDEGPNLEIVTTSHNPWQVHLNAERLAKVSRWRAWVEISNIMGRTQELADVLLAQLEEQWFGTD
jgi:DNA-binding transcriptional regulator YhcF (GntR family)